jgi:hypothetical protein
MTTESMQTIEQTPEETPELIIDLHPPFETEKSTAKWSENKQRYYYKPKDKEYEKRHYHKHKHEMTCEFCGSVVITQMYKHIKSKKCLMYRDAVQKTMDKYNIEEGKLIQN